MKRIGVAFPGDPSRPSTWSGTPSGVMRGLAAVGAEPVGICAAPAPALNALAVNAIALRYVRPARDVTGTLRLARAAALASPQLATVNTWAASRALRHAGQLDGIVQIGAGYVLETDVPVVSLEDMTVPQTRSHVYVGWNMLSPKAFDAKVALQRRVYDQAVACCMTTRWAADSAVRDQGVAPEKVHVVGVGRNHTAPTDVPRAWSPPRFLFVGMDWPRKNGEGVLRAFARLREELPDATLDLVGTHPKVVRPGVTGHGVLRMDDAEQKARLERLFASSTCFVMPSHSEAGAIAYVDAAAAGLPSIGTTSGGSDYLIGDGGLVVDPSDDDALLAAMRTFSDAETARTAAAAAKRRSELFTWPAVARRLLAALEGEPADPLAA